MNTISIPAGARRCIRAALEAQPERFFDGNNWAGRVYVMSDQNRRQQARILGRLRQGWTIELSDMDARYLYAVAEYAFRRPYTGMTVYGYETLYGPSTTDSTWRSVERMFQSIGISRADYIHGWGD